MSAGVAYSCPLVLLECDPRMKLGFNVNSDLCPIVPQLCGHIFKYIYFQVNVHESPFVKYKGDLYSA